MITDNLTNTVYFSNILPKKCPILNKSITEAMRKYGIQYAYLSETKDIWCRDFMPIQIEKDLFGFYNYTPDYLNDPYGRKIQTEPMDVVQAKANHLDGLLQKSLKIDLVMDGGNVVKCGDTVVMTDKVFVANNDKTRDEVERILHDAFQCDILFLPWDKEEKYGHSDGIVHYVGNGKIMLTNYGDFSTYYFDKYRKVLDKRFETITLKYKVRRFYKRSWAYINFLQVKNLILVPQLGTEEDEQALEQISDSFPECEVLGIPALEAVRRGGALNCISWNVEI